MSAPPRQLESPWPHRLAVLLALVVFPLIWLGGLVTTEQAGMAVPDWPSTYGYNLFLYPWQTWLFGPGDLFIEHGHRLLGALAGVITLLLVAAVYWTDRRPAPRAAALAALALVVAQGGLGGMRVLLDERRVALLHGGVGPGFFAFVVVLAVATSRWSQRLSAAAASHIRRNRERTAATSTEQAGRASHADAIEAGWRFTRFACVTTGLAYLQLWIGAALRHVPPTASAHEFRAAVWAHLLLAAVVAGHVGWLCWLAWRRHRRDQGLMMGATLLAVLTAGQLVLGAAAWVLKHAWPEWVADYDFAAGYVIVADSFWRAFWITLHVANGSLILATGAGLSFAAWRVYRHKGARGGEAAADADDAPAGAGGAASAAPRRVRCPVGVEAC